MIWSHMTTAQAVALRALFTQLGTARHRQYWRSALTHDDDYTCEVFDPTTEEITAIAALMTVQATEDAMSESPTPGQICYEGFWRTTHPDFQEDAWPTLPLSTQARWEAAAQAVLAIQQEDTPHA